MDELTHSIAITISELKGHALMGGTMMKEYADDIVSDTLKDLRELNRLAEIGLATEFMFTESRYPMALCEITQIDCTQGPLYVTDTDSLIDLYNGLKESEKLL